MDEIRQITVYQDRALVLRTQEIESQSDNPDTKTISFANIPQSVFLNSLRAKGTGNADFKIRSINQQYEYYETIPDEKINRMRLKLENLENQSFLLKEQSKKYEEFSALIAQIKLKNFNHILPDFAYQKCSLEEIEQLYVVLQGQRKKIEDQGFELKKQERYLSEEKAALTKKLLKMESGRTKTLLNVDVLIDFFSKGSGSFDLSYLVPDAGWRPFYEARLYLDQSELEMVYLAEVSQSTGEDWNDVELILSTARPSQGAALPELSTWWIDFYYPPKTSSGSMKKKSSKELPCSQTAALSPCVEEKVCEDMMEPLPEGEELMKDESVAEQSYSEVQQEGLNVSFVIPKKDSIGSGVTSKKVTVDKKKFPVKIQYIVIPKLAQNAFLKVTFENQSGYPYLAGDALIFHGSDYVGKSQIQTTVPGEEMELFMGVDENIKVERQLVSHIQSKKLFGGNKRTTYKYRTSLTNFRENEVKVSVFDHLPIPDSSEIKLKVESIVPKYLGIDKKNTMTWDLILKPKEKQEILIEFSVEYPKEMTPYGI